MSVTFDRDIRRIQNAKEGSVASGDSKNIVSHSPAVRTMSDGEQVFAQESNKPLALYKKNKGALWKVALSKDGNQVIEKNLEVKGKTVSNDVGIGTLEVPDGGIGYAKLAISGTTTSSAGPHIQYTTSADSYPVFQQLNWGHDNVAISFDSYYDGAWKSSDAGSNFQLYKVGDKFKLTYDSGIAQGSAVTWNDGIVLNTSGNITKPANSCFYLYASAAQDDIADGSDVTIVFGGEEFDLNGNCASNTFTAPVAGKYFLHANIGVNYIDTAASYYLLKIKTSNRDYEKWIDDKTFSADTGYHTFSLTAIADMDASDTAYVTLFQEGSNTHQTDILDDSNNSPARTYFTGYLIG